MVRDRLAAQRDVVRDGRDAVARSRESAAGSTPAARAFDGRDPGCHAACRRRPEHRAGFFGLYRADHPGATSPADLESIDEAMALPEAVQGTIGLVPADVTTTATLFASAPALQTTDLDDAAVQELFPGEWRHEERDEQGTLLSFFHGADSPRRAASEGAARAATARSPAAHRSARHAGRDRADVDRLDERRVPLDAHAGSRELQSPAVDDAQLSRACSARTVSASSSRSHGALAAARRAVGVRDDAATRVDGSIDMRTALIEVRSRSEQRSARDDCWRVECCAGEPRAVPDHASHRAQWRRRQRQPAKLPGETEGNAVVVAPGAADRSWRAAFRRAASHLTPLGSTEFRARRRRRAAVPGRPVAAAALRVHRHRAPARRWSVCDSRAARAESTIRQHAARRQAHAATRAAVDDACRRRRAACRARRAHRRHRALVRAQRLHSLPVAARTGAVLRRRLGHARRVPRAGRDAAGARATSAPIRDLLLRVMRAQNADGDWPQWFMFFERDRDIRAGDSHGDIVFWPVLALAQYLIASGDATLLDERVPFFDDRRSRRCDGVAARRSARSR